ncbi:SDR family oxidoreductase [Mucilaginibacter pocheonensis]|uniref:NAD(P)-dependent dehydrogenase (Short-subunit alcohol dehydrogenase family) n=1 Tax=Mucilaginibacter pocheonensis TaxID=398050 RepID=A0ABU1T8E0_9SPHI|nr:SDR family oxidoreductase [Mucilaginibacter pocheonensis]MDR6941667.1 NAD(P)-dependent dehydrogenase (short-subunit alcohol dehydrogenase family) [Mucilaginibacter pocheonensis]
MKKTVLITGASSGFGKAAVKLFDTNNWNVIATMRSPEKETELSALSNVFVSKLDVTDKLSIQRSVDEGIEKFGKIDVLVNNAGYGALGALEAATEEQIKQQFDVNFFGLINVTKAVLPRMRQQKSGIIINVSSVGGRLTFPFSSLYHATKFAVEGLTESMQYELNPFGIRLKIVEPGGYKTEFSGRSMTLFNTDGLDDYQPAFAKFITMIDHWPMSEDLSEVADVIYEAATDDTEKLRYPVGHDAVQLIQSKQQMDDVDFKKMMVDQTGL